MTLKGHKRDVRTRVSEPTFRAVERYAVAHKLTTYAATERLLELGVNALSQGDEAATRLQSSLDSVDGRLSELTKLTDRTLYSAAIAYAYARHTALGGQPEAMRQVLDEDATADGQAAYRRQRDQALGGA